MFVLNSPESVEISQTVPLRATELADITSLVLGFTVPQGVEAWKKLLINTPFSLPEAVVVLEIPGLKNPSFGLNKINHHNLILDESLEDVYAIVKQRILLRFNDKESSFIHGSLSNEEFLKDQVFHPELSSSILPENMELYSEKNKIFFNEIYQLNQLANGIKESKLKNNVPDYHWFQLQGIKSLNAANEPNSKEIINGEKALNQAISMLIQSYKEQYKNEVFIIAITNDAKQSHRNKRQVNSVEQNLNVAEPLSSDYPVIFNLLLWFTVIFVFSLLAISLSIAQMDPGRDSIIYRMTSNRMKKEN